MFLAMIFDFLWRVLHIHKVEIGDEKEMEMVYRKGFFKNKVIVALFMNYEYCILCGAELKRPEIYIVFRRNNLGG